MSASFTEAEDLNKLKQGNEDMNGKRGVTQLFTNPKAAVYAAGGAIIGFMLGNIPGAVIGAIIGLVLSRKF